MKINFEKLSAKNFLSIGTEPVLLDVKNGLSIITGTNNDKDTRSNGSGKSTVIESIYFALFGKTIRGLNKSDVVNKKTKKATEIILEFSDDNHKYKIIRTLKPSGLELHKDGKNVTRDSIANTQEEIEKILGVPEDVIKNCVIMGVNQTVPFMAQSKVEKRKFIEGIFDMSVFSEILKEARADYNEAMKQLTSLQSKKDEKEKNIEIYQEQSEKFEENKRAKIENLKEQIKKIKDDKEELKGKLLDVDASSLKNLKEQEQKLRERLDEVRESKLDKTNKELTTCQVEIKGLEKQKDGVFTSGECPTCKRVMSEEDKEYASNHIDEIQGNIVGLIDKKERLEHKLKEINNVINVIKEKIRQKTEEYNEIQSLVTKNDITKNKIEDCDNNIKRLLQNAKDIKEEVNELGEVLKKSQKELITVEKDIEETTKETEILDQVKFICGENGVKSYIVNKLLNIFNQKINYYLDKLNANCVLMFDEFFEEKIINDKKQECSYFNFSSGERRNIDIAIMFAFMDLQKLQGKFDTNMLAFDEIVDSALDVDGVNYVVDILLEKCKNENKAIYLITHRKELQNRATGEIINIIKENGISRRQS